MIQAIRETDFTAYINTEANRIDTSVTSKHIKHLAKFINDLDGAVFYAYGKYTAFNNRYTKLEFLYATPDIYASRVQLVPAGYFKYELYEISWIGAVSLTAITAPATETDVLPVNPVNGVVQGLVAIGKLYLGEKAGSEEVQYTEYTPPATDNTIYYGQ